MSEPIYRTDVAGRRVIDAAPLPEAVFGQRSPVWWGNTLLLCIESTTMLLLIVTYFYVKQNFAEWPPPNPLGTPPMFHLLPDLPIPIAETAVMVLGSGVMFWTDRVSRQMRTGAAKVGLWIMFALSLVVIGLRFKEFPHTHFRWNDNAYASVVWTILGLHLTYLLAAAAEFLIMTLHLYRAPLEEHHAHDINLTGIYWYWAVVVWLIVFGVIYFVPRWF